MRKKIPIKYSVDRVVLSDVLPYETPVTFSNRYFYNYLLKRKKSKNNSEYKSKFNRAHKEIEDILFSNSFKNKPFGFKINHNKNDFRELNIIHPHNQEKMVKFYSKYQSLILYYCSISPFSIRKPVKIANFIFYNDVLHKKNEDNDLEHSQIEQDDSEYENLKSFFSYQKYSNIHKFYESYQFHRCEKKYNYLYKIDVSKCFDSIYTHTVSWAIYNKKIIKDNISPSLKTFAGKFDEHMQNLNANETNGIIIGPEFSRIFAELILQQIDVDIYDRLRSKDENGTNLIYKVDYEIFRYVDDYFIFYNNEIDISRIIEEFKLSLKEYKMYINDSKSILYGKPIITEISIAKQKISDLFNSHLIMKEKSDDTDTVGEGEDIATLYFSSNNVITRFKSIIKESNIEYKDIMNYSLAVLDKKTAMLIRKFKNFDSGITENTKKEFEKSFLEILDVAFFLYSVSPRVNSTIKICLLINRIIGFLKSNKTNDYKEPFLSNNKHNVFKKISDEIGLILKKNKSKKETQVESLYLLIALNQLGREYRLNYKVLSSYFNIRVNSKNELELINGLNYFSITVMLFYIKDIEIYKPILELLKSHITNKFEEGIVEGWRSNTELVLLLLDILSCPYLNDSFSRLEKVKLISDLDELYTSIIKPMVNKSDYINEIRDRINKLYQNKSLEKVKKKILNKISDSFNDYVKEIEKYTGFDIYKHEERFVNTVYYLKEDINNNIEKYFFKRNLLSLLKIYENQDALIEQEKFWFTKWTEFDFGLELQAKRSQEVY